MGHKEVNIGTVAGLLEALDESNAMIRTGTLQAIASQPEKALSLAGKGDLDLFSELVNRRDHPREAGIRAYYVHALLSLDDERGIEMAKEEFLTTADPDIILLTARQIAALPEVERVCCLEAVVMETNDPTRGRAAANLLAGCRGLPTRLAIRVSVLADRDSEIPALDDDSLADWLKELQGPYLRKTRKILLGKKNGSFTALLERWNCLPVALRIWALHEALKEDSVCAASLVGQVLAGETEETLLLSALKVCPSLAPDSVEEGLVASFQRHANPMLRVAAIQASQVNAGWKAMLENERSPEVKVAIINRLGDSRDASVMSQLVTCLEDHEWRVRAAATASLVVLAPASIPLLKELFSHINPTVRTAAGQALQQLGMGEWLAAQLKAA